MAGLTQQFELNRQVMQGVLAQLQNQNQNQNQQHGVNLRDFVRLNPTTFHNPDQPLDTDDWLLDITRQLESARVNAADYITFATYFLRGPAAQWWDTHKSSLAKGTIVSWNNFKTAFRAHYIPQAVINRMKAEFCNLVQGNKTVEAYQR